MLFYYLSGIERNVQTVFFNSRVNVSIDKGIIFPA